MCVCVYFGSSDYHKLDPSKDNLKKRRANIKQLLKLTRYNQSENNDAVKNT